MDEKIATLDQRLQPYAQYLVDLLRSYGADVVVTSGRRSVVRQQELIRAGRTTATRSLHLSGLAFDLQISGQGIPSREWLLFAGEIWEEIGGRWGGRFRSKDPIHFDVGLSG